MAITTAAPLVKYDVTEAQIAAIGKKCEGMTCDTPKDYEIVRSAIGDLRDARVKIEKRRVELKADALAFGRLVDSEAKRFTVLIEAVENPLKAKKALVDDAKAREKAEAEAAKIRAIEAEIAANRARQEAEAKALRDAEDARLKIERERLDAERRQLDEERRKVEEAGRAQREKDAAALRLEQARQAEVEAAQRREREKLDAERREIEAARQRQERAEFERQAKLLAEEEAKAKIEADRIAAAALEAKLAALKPDLEKVRAFADAIRALAVPKVKSKKVTTVLAAAQMTLEQVAGSLDEVAKTPRMVA